MMALKTGIVWRHLCNYYLLSLLNQSVFLSSQNGRGTNESATNALAHDLIKIRKLTACYKSKVTRWNFEEINLKAFRSLICTSYFCRAISSRVIKWSNIFTQPMTLHFDSSIINKYSLAQHVFQVFNYSRYWTLKKFKLSKPKVSKKPLKSSIWKL